MSRSLSLGTFEASEQAVWREYEELLLKAKKDIASIKKLRDLYSIIASHYVFLVKKDARSPQAKKLAEYLHQGRQILDVTVEDAKQGFFQRLFVLYFKKIPQQIYQCRRLFFLSALFFGASVLSSFWLTVQIPEFGSGFLGSQNYHHYRSQVELGLKFQNFFVPESSGPVVFVAVFLNNVKVALYALLGGMLMGLGTLYILIKNAFLVGGLLGIYYQSGHFVDFVSTIFQHGFLELMAIILAGTAGFLIASPYFFSGHIRKKDLFRKKARQAMLLFTGTLTLLFAAAMLEGLVTTLHLPIPMRFAVIGATFFFFSLYLVYSLRHSYRL